MTYNPWPIGKIPEHLQRPELRQLKEAGYEFNDAREVITLFENKVAAFAGSKYAVAVDCCTHALELALRYRIHYGYIKDKEVIIPANTYVSVYMMLVQLGFEPRIIKEDWSGIYSVGQRTTVIDAAVRWAAGMYVPNSLFCLSFQIKKMIPIGRGGMVLTDDPAAAHWIRLASYDGRELRLPYDHANHIKMQGFHYYMTPEDAARGILLMDQIKTQGDTGTSDDYPDIRKMLNL